MRRNPQQTFALYQRFVDQSKLEQLQVAQAAVYELGAGGRGCRSQIGLLDQSHFVATAGRIARDAGPIDAATDDQQVNAVIAGHVEC